MEEFPKEVLAYFQKNKDADLAVLALKSSPFPTFKTSELIAQLQGIQVAKKKFPFFLKYPQLKYPPKISLEQSSSEACAKFKGNLVNGTSFIDLTGGFGLDTFWVGKKIMEAAEKESTRAVIHYVEPNENLQLLAQRNFAILGLTNVQYHQKKAEEFLNQFSEKVDWIYIDPSRRISAQRKINLTAYEPNIIAIKDQLLARGKKVLIKLSPMQDISDLVQQLDQVTEIYLCEWDKELKELLIVLDPEKQEAETTISVVPIDQPQAAYARILSVRQQSAAFGTIESFVFEPGPSLQKSGLINAFGSAQNLKKVQANSQLLFGKELFIHPLGKSFQVIKNTTLKSKEILPYLPEKKANVIVRNYPAKAVDIKKKLNIKEGGKVYLLATRDEKNKPRILICKRITQ